jgi:hypothetical protein
MNDREARLKLADELSNLVEALKDDDYGAGIMTELEGNRELQLVAVLGDDTTLLVLKRWTKTEMEEVRRKAEEDEEWPELLEFVGGNF